MNRCAMILKRGRLDNDLQGLLKKQKYYNTVRVIEKIFYVTEPYPMPRVWR